MSGSVSTRRVLLGGAAAVGLPLLGSAQVAAAQDVTSDETSVALLPSTSERNVMQGQSSSVLPLTIRARADQEANLQEWQAADGRKLVAVERTGRISRRDAVDSHGPWTWEIGESVHDGVTNAVSYFGYNVGNRGQPVKSGEPYSAMVIESDYYEPAIAARTMEMYFEARSADNKVNMRPITFQFRRDATTPESFLQYSVFTGNPFRIVAPRSPNEADLPGRAPDAMADFMPNRLELYAIDPHDNFLRVNARPNRNAGVMLQSQGEDSARLTTVGKNQVHLSVQNRPLRLYSVNGNAAVAMAVNADDNGAAGTFAVGGSWLAAKALVARGREGQQGNILEAQDVNKTVLSGFDKKGAIFTRVTAAPADADVPTGQMVIWLDDDPAATALRVKARDRSGAIKTGSIPLGAS